MIQIVVDKDQDLLIYFENKEGNTYSYSKKIVNFLKNFIFLI